MYRESIPCVSSPTMEAACGRIRTRTPSSENHGTDSGNVPVKNDRGAEVTKVEYRLHEFGLLSPLQGFAYWPGFSLNPALWDLARLRDSYGRKYGRKFAFDPEDVR